MDASDLLNRLNDKQQAAVAAPCGKLLVLAGAGSGKTRVLVHRIAWLLSVENHSPDSVLAVTFTNKASAEIRKRIQQLIGSKQSGIWIGTFHGLAYRLLRAHYQDVNLPPDFLIIDNEDQLRLLKRLIRAMNLDDKQWSSRQAMWYIGSKKDKGLRPQGLTGSSNLLDSTWQRIYQTYQEACDRAGLVDFSELLLRGYELLLKNKSYVLCHYRARFTNILVDEFQDTNQIQYAWLRLLASNNSNMMIIGDDDQSIYGWRGARVENIQRFLEDFPKAQTIRLEQNYRSTSNILQAANTLIANNGFRLGKKLWTKDAEGDPITLYCACNELDEARFVIHQIKMNQQKGGALKDCAILYRSNAQSRIFEEILVQIGLPYRIYGGTHFFESQEIKDVIAYLRLIANRNDDTAYERVVNMPPRGLGNRTLDVVRNTARNRKLTLWQSSWALLSENLLSGRAASALQQFLELLNKMEKETAALSLGMQTDQVIKNSGLWNMYRRERSEKSQVRIENLEELVTASCQFHYINADRKQLPLHAFLSHISLEAKEDPLDTYQDAVQLMTLHAAKGLEFKHVFIVGMEEGIFPSHMSLNERSRLEEERRLAYVGLTRAMKKLTITYAETRRVYGKEVCHQASRFIAELPLSCIEEVHMRANVSYPSTYYPMGIFLKENDSECPLTEKSTSPNILGEYSG
ncbi:DNA helicase II [Candidatus Steffania adelgidicola]|nr:DNA helicase II [Candidatus Steffania adelgidicola]